MCAQSYDEECIVITLLNIANLLIPVATKLKKSSRYAASQCGSVSCAISFVAYIIAMGVGWALDQMFPGDITTRAAAIVSTIPVISIAGYLVVACMFGAEVCKPWASGCMITCIVFSWLFEIVGGVLFIVAGVSHDLEFGVTAGVFSIVAGFSCCGYLFFLPPCFRKSGNQESVE